MIRIPRRPPRAWCRRRPPARLCCWRGRPARLGRVADLVVVATHPLYRGQGDLARRVRALGRRLDLLADSTFRRSEGAEGRLARLSIEVRDLAAGLEWVRRESAVPPPPR